MPTRASEAYAEIRRRIVELELRPGATFTETEIACALGISRTLARDGLARLHAEGLVEVLPRSGYRVAPTTIKTAHELVDLRRLLEEEVAAQVAATVKGHDPLTVLRALGEVTYDGDDPVDGTRRYLDANAQFHLALATRAGNAKTTSVLQQLFDQLDRFLHLGLTVVDEVHDHTDLLDSIAAGDADAARSAARAHVEASRDLVLAGLFSAGPSVA